MIYKQLMKKLMDLSEKGYVTYDEINELLGPELVDTELYEEIMDFLQERGVKIVDTEEALEEKEDTITISTESLLLSGKDGDPVRLYLKDMGKIPLLKREEEIKYAKQIETGRKIMRRGLLRTSFLIDRVLREWGEVCNGKVKATDLMDTVDESKTLEENVSLLEKFCKNIFYVGRAGDATRLKLINNMVLGGFMQVLAEAIGVGERCGFDRELLIKVLESGAGKSYLLDVKKKKLLERDYSVHFSVDLIHKDLHYAEDMVKDLGTFTFTLQNVKNAYALAKYLGMGGEDFSVLAEVYNRLTTQNPLDT